MREKRGTRVGLRRVRWVFEDSPVFGGYTDDTTWNGWLNVWVTEETHEEVIRWIAGTGEDYEDFQALGPDLRGLVSYAYGFTAQEV